MSGEGCGLGVGVPEGEKGANNAKLREAWDRLLLQ